LAINSLPFLSYVFPNFPQVDKTKPPGLQKPSGAKTGQPKLNIKAKNPSLNLRDRTVLGLKTYRNGKFVDEF